MVPNTAIPSLASWLAGRNDVAAMAEATFASADARMARGRFRSADRVAEHGRSSFPALTVQLLTRGQLSFVADLGCGRFGGTSTAGAVIVTPPGEACDIRSDGEFESLALAIPPALVEALLAPLNGGHAPDLSPLYAGILRSRRLNDTLAALWTATATDRADRLLVQAGILAALSGLVEAIARPPDHRPPGGLSPVQLRTACEAMAAGADITLVELATLVGLSPSHFGRAFRRSTGLSPSTWLTHRRIDRAKDLLRDPENSLSQIALDVGFSAQPQFTTAFKRATGLPPAAWRRMRD